MIPLYRREHSNREAPDNWYEDDFNYMMLLAEGRFINESLFGLIENTRSHNLQKKIEPSDPILRNRLFEELNTFHLNKKEGDEIITANIEIKIVSGAIFLITILFTLLYLLLF
jgi:hypothetical protein